MNNYLQLADSRFKIFYIELDRMWLRGYRANTYKVFDNINIMFDLIIDLWNKQMYQDAVLFESQVDKVYDTIDYIKELLDEIALNIDELKNLIPNSKKEADLLGSIVINQLNYHSVYEYILKYNITQEYLLKYRSSLKKVCILNIDIAIMAEAINYLCLDDSENNGTNNTDNFTVEMAGYKKQ